MPFSSDPASHRARAAALLRLHRRYNTALLATAYLAALATILLTTWPNLALLLLQWIMIPCFVAALAWPVNGAPADAWARLRRSAVLQCAFVYLATLLIATALRSDAPASVVWHDLVWASKRGVEVMFFLAIGAYLAIAAPRFLRMLTLTMAGLLALAGIVDIAAWLLTPKAAALSGYRLEGSIGMKGYRNATHVAALFTTFGLGTLALSMRAQAGRLERVLLLAAASIILATMVLTQARGGIAIAFCGVVALAALSRQRSKWLVLSLIAVVLVVAFANHSTRQALLERGDSFRGGLFTAYADLAKRQPWFGYGIGTKLIVTVRGSDFEQPHNMYLWAQVRGGVVASLALAAMMASAIYRTFVYWRRVGDIVPLVIVVAVTLTGLTEIGMILTQFDWIWVVFWLPIGIAAGAELATATGSAARESPDPALAV